MFQQWFKAWREAINISKFLITLRRRVRIIYNSYYSKFIMEFRNFIFYICGVLFYTKKAVSKLDVCTILRISCGSFGTVFVSGIFNVPEFN